MGRLVGGPCDGVPTLAGAPPTLVCKGVTYYKGGDGNYYPRDSGGGGGFAGGAHQLDSAWRRLMRAYGVTMTRALRRSAAGRSRMKRVVR